MKNKNKKQQNAKKLEQQNLINIKLKNFMAIFKTYLSLTILARKAIGAVIQLLKNCTANRIKMNKFVNSFKK